MHHPALGIHFGLDDYLDLQLEAERDKRVDEHWKSFWKVDFDEIFSIAELHDADEPEELLAIGRKLVQTYKDDLKEYLGEH